MQSSSDTSSQARVLFVEDDPAFLDLVPKGLGDMNLEFVGVGDWVQAMQRLLVESFDLALVDVGLPGVDGTEVVQLVREVAEGQGREIPVLLYSGLPRQELARVAFQTRADGYASKADGIHELRSLLVRTLKIGAHP